MGIAWPQPLAPDLNGTELRSWGPAVPEEKKQKEKATLIKYPPCLMGTHLYPSISQMICIFRSW